ncbi:hypothetical protein Prum_068200 [Phytohabitans rumicis]|uniref:CU044_5270 family protein n=2 Tax=Phytohabitans rumicis TaxID=1076125 RepID=A0A6V8LDX3_9ACTN|nr:hypothetical protein Prum_068200 [Phytohabitans rumicis]
MAVVVAALTVVLWPSHATSAYAATPPGLNYQPGPQLPAATVLQQLASAAQATDRPGGGTVEYLRIESWDLNASIDGQQVTTAVVPSETQIWRQPDDAAVTIARYGTPWFPDDDAEQAWKANRSPGSDTTPRRTDDPPGGHAWLWDDRPPPNADQLRAWLRRNHNITDTGGYFTAVVDLLKERVLTGKELASVLRLLASLPTVDYTGPVTDRTGRPGEAFSTTSTSGGLPVRHTLIVDRTSGRFLAYERTLTTTAGSLNVRIPAVTSYVIFHDARFTTGTP